MTFSITAAGTKDQALAQIDAGVEQHARYNTNPTTELEKVVDLLKHYLEVGAFPGGVFLEANGHLGAHGGSLQLNIKPLYIPQPPAPAAPVEAAQEPAAEPAATTAG